MTTANGRRVMQVGLTLILLSVPASPQQSRPATPQNSRPVGAQEEQAAEQKLWDSIKDGSGPQGYQTFLREYPHGRFAGEARARLSALLGEGYVTLFTRRVNVNRRWADVENVLGRRAAVIPRLYETLLAAGVQKQEFDGQIAEPRSRLLDALHAPPRGDGATKTPEQKQMVIDAADGFDKALRRLDSLPESHPQLLSNEKFVMVRDELAGAENRIAVARSEYNGAVRDYQTARQGPRMSGVAERYGFTEEPYFESEQGQPVEPKVNRVRPVSTDRPLASRIKTARHPQHSTASVLRSGKGFLPLIRLVKTMR